MISEDLTNKVRRNLPFAPTAQQEAALELWCGFLLSRQEQALFLLRGYAGTGKSSLVGGMVQALLELGVGVTLLAPTGRAAKVMAGYAGAPAYTIHKRIYRQRAFADSHFEPNVNLKQHTLFIVDEGSMIANSGLGGSVFGTGRLLNDLVAFVYSCPGCRLMVVGDTAQLPPVEEEQSPALEPGWLASYGLEVIHTELTQVVRQQQTSGILWNATRLRQLVAESWAEEWPQMRVGTWADIRAITGSELIECLEDSYYHCGTDQTIVVTRSNRQAYRYNMGIRTRIMGYEEELSGGDLLMVAKNNYYWSKGRPEMPFIANGDVAVVSRVRNERSLYGFRFLDVTLQFPDYNHLELDATVLLDTLGSEHTSLGRDDQERLFQAVWDDYPEIGNKAERAKRIKEDPYFNALQIKYAYAVTCHKAQGGQWQRVFVDQGYVPAGEPPTPDYLRWLYTALTRATGRVYLVNWPDEQLERDERAAE